MRCFPSLLPRQIVKIVLCISHPTLDSDVVPIKRVYTFSDFLGLFVHFRYRYTDVLKVDDDARYSGW